MHRGERVAGRFEIEEHAGDGGMGTVYRAVDRKTRSLVAVKVLRSHEMLGEARFAREAALLAELSHPGIVRYIAHGATPEGLHYLVMEWVDGETLARRLARGGVTPADAVTVAAQAAAALGAAHDRGVVHRDVKPSNLMFPSDGAHPIKVVDFGIARLAADEQRLTQSGVVVGTLGYMAPEQARGQRAELAAVADVFALGCVLHECLTGCAPFSGEAMLAVRAKLLLCDPPRLRQLRPELPAALDDLCTRMLAKDPAARPRDGGAVAAELAALGELPGGAAAAVAVATGPRTPRSTTVVASGPLACVVLAGRAHVDDSDGRDATAATLDQGALAARGDELAAAVAPWGGRVELCDDGSWVVTLRGAVASAARCALALRALLPDAPMVLAAGPPDTTALDGIIDSGARALARGSIDETFASGAPPAPRGIWLDETSALQLGPGFEVQSSTAGTRLLGEAAA